MKIKTGSTLIKSKSGTNDTKSRIAYDKEVRTVKPKRQDFKLQIDLLSVPKSRLIPNPKILKPVNGIPTFVEVKSAWGYLYNNRDNVITLSKKIEERSDIEAGGYIIGSDPSCDIRLKHPGAPKRHAFIFCRPRTENNKIIMRVSLHDQSDSSTDGIWVNNKKMDSGSVKILYSNDVIHFMDPIAQKNIKINPGFTFVKPKRTTIAQHNIDSLYQVSKPIGEGAYGEVFLGVCKSTGKRVAIKKIDMKNCKSPSSINSLLREVSVCMAFPVHPCIIQTTRVFEQNDNLYIVMEYGANGDLFTQIADPEMNLRLREFEIKIIFDQIAHAILYLHEQNVVHRDLKMENVIMCDRKRLTVKLCDFGLSTFTKRGETLVTKCGTMMYAAPELLKLNEGGKGYGAEVDIWSLGVLLYTALTNSTPFPQLDDETDESKDKLKHHILNALYTFSHPGWKSISKEAQDLIKNMLLIDPKERYTIQQVIAHPWLQGIETDEKTQKAGLSRNKELVEYLEKRKETTPISSPQAL